MTIRFKIAFFKAIINGFRALISNDSKGVILFGIFCLIYFFHGWLGAFYNVIIYGFILSIFFRIKLRKKNETK